MTPEEWSYINTEMTLSEVRNQKVSEVAAVVYLLGYPFKEVDKERVVVIQMEGGFKVVDLLNPSDVTEVKGG
jgi:hypothetical protein